MRTDLHVVDLLQLRALLPEPNPLITARRRQNGEQWLTRITPLMSEPGKPVESKWVPVTHGESVPIELFPLIFQADLIWAWVDGMISGQTIPEGELLLIAIGKGEQEWVQLGSETRPRIWVGAAVLVTH